MVARRERSAGKAAPTASSEDDLSRLMDDVPTILVSGEFANRVSVVNRTDTDLLFSIGRVAPEEQEANILVPYVEISWSGAEIGDSENIKQMHTQLLGLDNWAFALADMGRDLAIACDQFAKVAAGAIRPDQMRIKLTRLMLENASSSLGKAAETLKRLETDKVGS